MRIEYDIGLKTSTTKKKKMGRREKGLSRHANGHCRRSHAIKDILNKLVPGLHLGSLFVKGNLLWEDSIQEFEKLRSALDRIGNLQIVSRPELEDSGTAYCGDRAKGV